jgi:hypothetical protein
MRKILALCAVALMLCSVSAFAHVPEGVIYAAWQWPTSHLPTLDGDISEWEVIPAELWLDQNNPDIIVGEGDVGRAVDAANLAFRFAASWNDELDRMYFVFDRFDDVWDRDGGGVGCCGQDDSIEISVDADHSGEWFWYNPADFDDDEEQTKRNRGRHAQTAHYRWPALEPFGWKWFWMTDSDWHDKEPYACCADSYTLNGSHGSEATMQAEWYTAVWDDYDHASPETSITHDLVEGEIIGMGMQIVDNDNGTEDDPKTAKWSLGGQPDIYGNGASISDFLLLPVDMDLLPTAVENDSWGHIKASFAE